MIYFSVSVPAEPIAQSVTAQDLRTGGRCSNPSLGLYSFRGLVIVITTGSIHLSPLSIVSTMFMRESSQWLGKNILQSTDKTNSSKAWTGTVGAAI